MKVIVLALVVGIVAAHHEHRPGDAREDEDWEIPAYGVTERNRPTQPKEFPKEKFRELFDKHVLIFYPDHDYPDRLTGYYVDKGFSNLHLYRSFERINRSLRSRRDLVAYVFYPGGFHSPRFFDTYIRECHWREDLRVGEFLRELSDTDTTPIVVFWPRQQFENAQVKLDFRLGSFRLKDDVFHTVDYQEVEGKRV